jgi:ppGpp synthetase/RelA/SpoT-type nucleotidyltranferase
MDLDIEKVVNTWKTDEPRFKRLAKGLFPILKNSINELELFPEVTFRVKDLLSIIRKIKKKRLLKTYNYEDLKDKLGFRIICSFVEDMDTIDKYIIDNFTVKKIDKKKDLLDPNKLDYISNHYDLSISTANKIHKKLFEFSDLVFELQVKTLNQHTWSTTAHALSYKQEAKLSDSYKRKIFRLLSLYEIADDEFSIVNSMLCQNIENVVYILLRKTEGKIYRYAKVDFDRELSLHVFNKLVTYFDQTELNIIIKNIDSFISDNEKKIKRIFRENAKRFYEISFLTQPEIFVIWYGLAEYPFSITDNWNNDFEAEDLEQIQILWGKEV